MYYNLGKEFKEVDRSTALETENTIIVLLNKDNWENEATTLGFSFESDIDFHLVHFTKAECYSNYIMGTIVTPKPLHNGKKHELLFLINNKFIVLVDETDFSKNIMTKLLEKQNLKINTKAHFIYSFFNIFMHDDIYILDKYENDIIKLEDNILNNKVHSFNEKITPMRKNLLKLRCHYEQISDVAKELQDSDNGFFTLNQLKYFDTLSDRAERLKNKTSYLLEYSQQIRDIYKSQVDDEQNKTMQFLTIISTIFFPLTLITGWYGMNFQNMPELANGYPIIIIISIIIILSCIVYFKRKKLL